MGYPLSTIYDRLAGEPDESIDLAMAAALPTADAAACGYIAQTLLKRKHSPSLTALVVHYHRLEPAVQQLVIDNVLDLYRPLREATELRTTAGPANAMAIIRRACHPKLAYLALSELKTGIEAVRPEAAACLLEMCRAVAAVLPTPEGETSVIAGKAVGANPATPPLSPDAAPDTRPVVPAAPIDALASLTLQEAVEEALRLYQYHNQADVLRAIATLAPRAMPGAVSAIEARGSVVAPALRLMIEMPDDEAIRRSLLSWARVTAMQNSVMAGVSRTVGRGTFGDVLSLGHLAAAGPLAQKLRNSETPETLAPSADAVAAMNSVQRRALVHWLRPLNIDAERKAALLAPLARDSDPGVRLAALRLLIDSAPLVEVTDLIASLCRDADLAIARIAMRHLIRARWPGMTHLLLKLLHSQHAEIRKLAARRLAPLGFEKLWDAWPRLSTSQQLAAGRALLKLDPSFPRLLGERLNAPERPIRLRALAIIQGLNQGSLFEPALLALARDLDPVIASAAVRVLGTTPTPQSAQVLEQHLNHEDSRVRANAVEALQALNATKHVDQLLKMAAEEDPRPRANAINALMQMRTNDAMSALLRMLADDRADQRTSALWLVDHLGVVEVARHIAEMAISDGDPSVKQRAGLVVENLIGLLNAMSTATRQVAQREGIGEASLMENSAGI